ncbi:hypothetical protein Tdes44962_MAKER10545, partial [Teratosphaeria destructans]
TEKAKTLKKTTSLAPDKLALSPKGQEKSIALEHFVFVINIELGNLNIGYRVFARPRLVSHIEKLYILYGKKDGKLLAIKITIMFKGINPYDSNRDRRKIFD